MLALGCVSFMTGNLEEVEDDDAVAGPVSSPSAIAIGLTRYSTFSPQRTDFFFFGAMVAAATAGTVVVFVADIDAMPRLAYVDVGIVVPAAPPVAVVVAAAAATAAVA